ALHMLRAPESKMSLLVMISGALILVANLAVAHRIAVRLAPESPLASSIAVWLTALYYPLVYWTLRGMEVGLVTLLLSASVLMALRLHERFRDADLTALAVLVAFGILTRPDVIVPCGVVAAFVFLTSRPDRRARAAVILGTTIAGTFALHTACRFFYYSGWLPNTYYLKVSGAALGARLDRGLRGLAGFALLHLLAPLALSAGYLIVRTRLHHGVWLLVTIFLALCGYSAYVGGDVWDAMFIANRYITPGVPGLLILTALAIDRIARGDLRPYSRAVIGLVALLILVPALNRIAPASTLGIPATAADERLRIVRTALLVAPVVMLPFVARSRAATAAVLTGAAWVAVNGFAVGLWIDHGAWRADDEAGGAQYGLALRRATADDASVAVSWAGAIPYFSRRPSVDLLGKSDPVVAMRPRQASAGFEPGHDKWDYEYSIRQLRPDVVA